MKRAIEIKIVADIPDDADDAGHRAIVDTRDPVMAIVDLLAALGLQNAGQTRKIARKAGVRPVPALKAAE